MRVFLIRDLSTERTLDVRIKSMDEGRATTIVWSAPGTATMRRTRREVVEWLRENLNQRVS